MLAVDAISSSAVRQSAKGIMLAQGRLVSMEKFAAYRGSGHSWQIEDNPRQLLPDAALLGLLPFL
jgi:hypothetical protein